MVAEIQFESRQVNALRLLLLSYLLHRVHSDVGRAAGRFPFVDAKKV
jgi:hypothetical protein